MAVIREVLPGALWQSGRPADPSEIDAADITAVVNVGVGCNAWAAAWQRGPVTLGAYTPRVYLHHPLRDGSMEGLDRPGLFATVRFMIDMLRTGRRVLVHCDLGQNRSGLVCGMAMVVCGAMDGVEATARLRQAGGPDVLGNRGFERFLAARRPEPLARFLGLRS